MAARTTTIHLEIRVAWWAKWYLSGVAFFATLFGTTPDFERIERMVLRAISVKPVRR